MLADTDAIRAFGGATDAQAADLAAVAAALAAIPAPAGLGPVGAGFVAALIDATTAGAREAAALGRRVSGGAGVAGAAAQRYDDTARRGADDLVRRV